MKIGFYILRRPNNICESVCMTARRVSLRVRAYVSDRNRILEFHIYHMSKRIFVKIFVLNMRRNITDLKEYNQNLRVV